MKCINKLNCAIKFNRDDGGQDEVSGNDQGQQVGRCVTSSFVLCTAC